MMSEAIELMRLFAQPTDRRCWLLLKALESVPLDQAVGWARTAETFIAGGTLSNTAEASTVSSDGTVQAGNEVRRPIDAPTVAPASTADLGTQNRSRMSLSPERREQLLRRLAQGARNAELATEFELTSQQVQGLRIGLARKKARSREECLPTQPAFDQTTAIVVTVDEVVRYLRQQDDVVVSAEKGAFLVNGRFKLDLIELVARANRMRMRQGKPDYELCEGSSTSAGKSASANGHSMSRSQDAAPPTSTEHH
jgi:hypothetical protein